jgi:hypothetical protein
VHDRSGEMLSGPTFSRSVQGSQPTPNAPVPGRALAAAAVGTAGLARPCGPALADRDPGDDQGGQRGRPTTSRVRRSRAGRRAARPTGTRTAGSGAPRCAWPPSSAGRRRAPSRRRAAASSPAWRPRGRSRSTTPRARDRRSGSVSPRPRRRERSRGSSPRSAVARGARRRPRPPARRRTATGRRRPRSAGRWMARSGAAVSGIAHTVDRSGGVAERSNAPVLKTGVRSRGPRVRIPPPPLVLARQRVISSIATVSASISGSSSPARTSTP